MRGRRYNISCVSISFSAINHCKANIFSTQKLYRKNKWLEKLKRWLICTMHAPHVKTSLCATIKLLHQSAFLAGRLCNSRVAACVTRYTRYEQLRKKNRKSHLEGTFLFVLFGICTLLQLCLRSMLGMIRWWDWDMLACLKLGMNADDRNYVFVFVILQSVIVGMSRKVQVGKVMRLSH